MISYEQFLLRQPSSPQETSTDKFYFEICQRLCEIAKNERLFSSYPEAVIDRAALTLIGYYQDIICDAGVWRSFINENRRLYGYTVPFYNDQGRYTDYELNRSDVRFIVWYSLSMFYENRRFITPHNPEIIFGADRWFDELEKEYEDAPLPEDYRMVHELEIHSEEDSADILKLGNWLFLHCYLMIPAYSLTLTELAAGIDLTKEDGIIELQKRMDRSMAEDPTGPLALFIGEWVYLLIEGKMPKERKRSDIEEHKYYKSFVKATNGKIIEFFDSYEKLNEFFIKALGWKEGEEHLPQLKGRHDYILKVDPEKGMLIAVDIARCVASPENPFYDKEYAKLNSFRLLSERGCCPPDLLIYICKNGWLPDAVFHDSEDHELVKKHWDFIARCYLQQYYRGD